MQSLQKKREIVRLRQQFTRNNEERERQDGEGGGQRTFRNAAVPARWRGNKTANASEQRCPRNGGTRGKFIPNNRHAMAGNAAARRPAHAQREGSNENGEG